MRRALVLVVALAACKGSEKEPAEPVKASGTGTGTGTGVDCAAVGAKMGALTADRQIEATFGAACTDDGWPDAAKQCVLALTGDEGADACLQLLPPATLMATAARLDQIGALPFTDPRDAAAIDCKAATRTLGMAWALVALRAGKSPPGVKPMDFARGLGSVTDEACTDDAWPEDVRTCLARLKIPQELAQLDACLVRLPPRPAGNLKALHAKVQAELSPVPSTATGGTDCAAVGDTMVRIWTLKAERSRAKHPEAAQWDLDHLDALRALVLEACTADAWPEATRSCMTGLKLPQEAPRFEECLETLSAAAAASLAQRSEALEAQRDQDLAAAGPGRDDCAAVGETMQWVLMVEAGEKSPEVGTWMLDHKVELAAVFADACREDHWTDAERRCFTSLKLPDDAPKSGVCLDALSDPSGESLERRLDGLRSKMEAELAP